MNIVPVKKTCDIVNGFAFESEHFNTQRKGLPVVRIRDVVRGFSKTFYSGDYEEAYEVNHGDLLIGMDGEFNIAEWRGGLALLNQRVCKIVAKPGIADPSFLKYRLGLLIKEIEDRTPFVTVKHLSSNDLKTSEIELPHIDEQKRIAAILDKADRLRRQRRFAQTLSDSFLQSVFIKMFGDPVANPMEWNKRTVGDELDVMQYGPRFYNELYSPTGIRIIRITDLDSSGELDFVSMPRLKVSDEDVKTYALKPGELIFARSGATVGKTALIPEKAPVCIAGAYFMTMRFKKAINPVFVRHLFAAKPIQSIIESRSRQSAQQNFSGPGLRELPLIVPPVPLQEKFAAIVQKFERIRRQQREATRQAEHLFQTLLHRAFRGEL